MYAAKVVRALSAAFLLILAFTIQPQAKADTYTLYQVSESSGSIDNIGITSDGTLVLYEVTSGFYQTFTPPSTFTGSTTLPSLTFDNGTSCTVANSGAYTNVDDAKCNNGREVFVAQTGGSVVPALFDGPNPATNLLYNGDVTDLLLDSMGDVAFVATTVASANGEDVNYLLFDDTSRLAVTPEPRSIMLLGTGLVGTFAILRKRRLNGGQREMQPVV